MHSKQIITAALLAVSAINAQSGSFFDVVKSQQELSLFAALVQSLNSTFADLIESFAPADYKTVLVPNNEAITSFMQKNDIKSPADVPVDAILPFLSYHILLNNVSSTELAQPGGNIVETKLQNTEFSLLKDNAGQVVYGHKADEMAEVSKTNSLQVKSGFGDTVGIVKTDVVFNQGLLHIVDGFLTLPRNCSKTIAHRGAERLVTYIGRVGLLDALDGTPGATCFAPSDAAIEAAGPVLMNMTDAEILDAIKFHILLDPYYTKSLKDGQVIETALTGKSVTVNIVGSDYYFNGVRAKTTNDIVRNGVAYVLDGIMPLEFNGTISGSTSTSAPATSTMPSTSMSTDAMTTTTGSGMTSTGTTSAPTTTGTPNAAGAIQVGGSMFVAGLMALAALV
ncbi:hypothetical protein H072_4808 [Dactylellina haptotyla CBS 200.50]|uniref:FAS1 domain-containing protein n=1 Tax=Dactylellina haptotyla (strain CBS 200.50) TaxID=1284197 RepID=S8C0V6_DACHA|nr:hypothetical protein H072_4808 [Dactylellina haptotyla CBS 200.50]